MTTFEGKVLIFTAPSGAGKTTVVRHLLRQNKQLAFSISATTRPIRSHEKEGFDYYFLSRDEFESRIEAGAFLEWEEVYLNAFYGTFKSEVERIWAEGHHIIFDVDVKGATSLKYYFGEKALSVFIKPPSLQVLVDRLRRRGTESTADLEKRIKRVKTELKYEQSFDRILVNDILEVTLKEAELIVNDFLTSE